MPYFLFPFYFFIDVEINFFRYCYFGNHVIISFFGTFRHFIDNDYVIISFFHYCYFIEKWFDLFQNFGCRLVHRKKIKKNSKDNDKEIKHKNEPGGNLSIINTYSALT